MASWGRVRELDGLSKLMSMNYAPVLAICRVPLSTLHRDPPRHHLQRRFIHYVASILILSCPTFGTGRWRVFQPRQPEARPAAHEHGDVWVGVHDPTTANPDCLWRHY